MSELTMVDAINRTLHTEMDHDDTMIVSGQDVGVDGGVFRVTDGLLDTFGEQRVIDTPLAESLILGSAVGMAAHGLRPVCEMQFSGFSYLALHQLESHAARMRWRTRGRFTVPLVVRMPYGAGVHALEHHSESKEVYFAHTPGLKMVVPSSPATAAGLLRSAVRDPDPVVYFEPKALYRSFREEVDPDEQEIEIGRARTLREGDDMTLVAWGAMVPRAQEAADRLADDDGIEVDLIDLLSLSPLDHETVSESVRRTGHAVIVHEAHRTFGPAGEIMARLIEDAFWWLETPVERVTGYDVPVPYFAREQDYLPSVDRIVAAARRSLEVASA
ncbi:MAG TPA: alpha-ketoacid dehydrogenase subunit beta [Candidatus Krumholzibacteria bacterium]|nr:alpha-ketoacid dehydrogenase subunit beta [Candidatus Krumholzibacteria bacterium]